MTDKDSYILSGMPEECLKRAGNNPAFAKVIARGIEVFEDKGRFIEWIKQPNTALSGTAPQYLLGSSSGIKMVLDEIGRIRTGGHS